MLNCNRHIWSWNASPSPTDMVRDLLRINVHHVQIIFESWLELRSVNTLKQPQSTNNLSGPCDCIKIGQCYWYRRHNSHVMTFGGKACWNRLVWLIPWALEGLTSFCQSLCVKVSITLVSTGQEMTLRVALQAQAGFLLQTSTSSGPLFTSVEQSISWSSKSSGVFLQAISDYQYNFLSVLETNQWKVYHIWKLR